MGFYKNVNTVAQEGDIIEINGKCSIFTRGNWVDVTKEFADSQRIAWSILRMNGIPIFMQPYIADDYGGKKKLETFMWSKDMSEREPLYDTTRLRKYIFNLIVQCHAIFQPEIAYYEKMHHIA